MPNIGALTLFGTIFARFSFTTDLSRVIFIVGFTKCI